MNLNHLIAGSVAGLLVAGALFGLMAREEPKPVAAPEEQGQVIRDKIAEACQAQFADISDSAVLQCQIRHTVARINTDRGDRDQAVTDALR